MHVAHNARRPPASLVGGKGGGGGGDSGGGERDSDDAARSPVRAVGGRRAHAETGGGGAASARFDAQLEGRHRGHARLGHELLELINVDLVFFVVFGTGSSSRRARTRREGTEPRTSDDGNA